MMARIMVEVEEPVLDAVGVVSYAELARLLGLTPQALYLRRSKGRPLVTGSECIRLFADHGIQPCVSRPDLIDFRIRRS